MLHARAAPLVVARLSVIDGELFNLRGKSPAETEAR